MKPSRPEEEPILCNYTDCAHGFMQAGVGRCPGDWNDPNCPQFITEEDWEKQMEADCD